MPPPTLLGFPRSPRNTRIRILVDRCLPESVAVGLDKFDEIHAVHLSAVYDDALRVADTQWIKDAGRSGWVGLTQNFKLPQVQREADAIVRFGTKVFSLSRADLPAASQGLVVGHNLRRIYRRIERGGGCFWRISERGPRKDID